MLGPFQQHMTRYQLELAQCNGNMGMALLRTFVDSYLFGEGGDGQDALQDGMLRTPNESTLHLPKEAVEHTGLPGVFLQPIEKTMEHVLRDYHELLCGPVASNDYPKNWPLLQSETGKKSKAAATKTAAKKYGVE